MYHGAEHKCINCIEHGLELNVENVMKSSRLPKRCGTSFLFFVIIVSAVFLMFIQVESHVWRIVIRLLLVPVIAGVSYEIIRLAGRSENPVVNLLSKPGMALQLSLIHISPCRDGETLGYRQAVRHSTLTAAYAGSNPASPVTYGALAQVVEHLTFNQVVRGSNPRCFTKNG